MGTKSEALAERFESTVRDAVTTVRTLSDADWKKVTEAEQWPVGVVAHHYATVLVPVAELAGALAAGQAPERFTHAKLNEMNAQHARDHAACTKAETLALLETGRALAAAVNRGLSDSQLAARHGPDGRATDHRRGGHRAGADRSLRAAVRQHPENNSPLVALATIREGAY